MKNRIKTLVSATGAVDNQNAPPAAKSIPPAATNLGGTWPSRWLPSRVPTINTAAMGRKASPACNAV